MFQTAILILNKFESTCFWSLTIFTAFSKLIWIFEDRNLFSGVNLISLRLKFIWKANLVISVTVSWKIILIPFAFSKLWKRFMSDWPSLQHSLIILQAGEEIQAYLIKVFLNFNDSHFESLLMLFIWVM